MPNQNDEIKALTFKCPDGLIKALPTWDYIVDRMSSLINPMTEKLVNINEALTVIDNRLDDWIPEEDD